MWGRAVGGGEPNTPTLLGHTLIKGIAKSHNVSTAQVSTPSPLPHLLVPKVVPPSVRIV